MCKTSEDWSKTGGHRAVAPMVNAVFLISLNERLLRSYRFLTRM
jgi:hypothetical protein